MKRFHGMLLVSVVLSCVPAFGQAPAGQTEAKKTSTLENLMTAYNGESNAKARYEAFAKKADEEGLAGVASLFRAASMSEGIHAEKHAAVIKKMGGTPEAKIETVDVRTTSENLEAAIKGESYERDTMYPEFFKQAREEKNRDAMQTFNAAKLAESEHAKFYTAALKDLNAWKAKKAFYVCKVCGYTTDNLGFEKCIVCFSPKEEYVKVE